MTETGERKKAWRRLAGELFSLAGSGGREGLDAALRERLRVYVAESGARRLAGFAPLPDEPDLMPFFREWAAGGGRLALPVWGGGREMRLRLVADVDADLAPGRGGILEPVPECAEIGAGEIDLCVAPGRFFSETGERLGRGAGCYDGLLAEGGARALGVAYDFQIVPVLPVDAHDRRMDAVMTPTRLLGISRDPL